MSETNRGTSGDTSTTSNPAPEQTDRKPYKDIDGNEIDAPVIPAYERELADAQNRADVDLIADVQERYHKARDERVKENNKRERDRRKDR